MNTLTHGIEQLPMLGARPIDFNFPSFGLLNFACAIVNI
jgi:hypothetical protein